jgi:hypothetical protein
VNHQRELDAIINSIAPSPLLENHIPWLEKNVAFLTRRLERVKRVKYALDALEELTHKQRRFQNRYRGKILRLTTVQQHREYLLMIARLRVKRASGRSKRQATS